MLIQTGGGLLELCVLAALQKEDLYGYKLTRQIKEVIEVSESSLYPVLRRLKKEGLLETYDRPIDGRNRRYYHVTQDGIVRLGDYRQEWEALAQGINSILDGAQRGDEVV